MTGSGFEYRDGALCSDAVALKDIAAEIGTPFYAYSAATMQDRYAALARTLAPLGGHIHYAVKANPSLAVIALFAGLGAGADVVSEGECRRALAAGVTPAGIVFSGVGRTAAELRFALEAGVGQINLESERDLELLGELAAARATPVEVAIRINPDIDAGTHAKIATGTAETKFGIPLAQAGAVYRHAAELPFVKPVGIAVHIGSQLIDLAPYDRAFAALARLVRALRAEGCAVSRLDLGGGLGVPYKGEVQPDLARYAGLVQGHLGSLDCALQFEPGRFLVAEAGVLIAQVLDVKPGRDRNFVILDAAMNDLVRPTLYDAYHPIRPLKAPAPGYAPLRADVVGPICETGDFLALDRSLPALAAGDLVAIELAGAYAASMGSTYNSRLLPPEVLITGDGWSVVRPRQTYEALFGNEIVPAGIGRRR